jgi:hypothetical protein
VNYHPLRQIGIRIAVLVFLWLVLTLLVYLVGLPKPYAWAAMLTMLSWSTFLRNFI